MKLVFLISLGIFAVVNILVTGFTGINNSIGVEFLNVSCIKPHHKYKYTTCQELRVRVDDELIYIPAEYETDLASIPRWLWSFVSPAYSSYIQPSILHDYLYECPNGISRERADDIFYYSLIKEGVSQFAAYKIYLAVRLFGKNHFNADGYCIYQSSQPAHDLLVDERIYLL